MQFYIDPAREQEDNALPDAEVFEQQKCDFGTSGADTWQRERVNENLADGMDHKTATGSLSGWYWWSCSPGCLPDGDANGPFGTEALAIADARKDGVS